MESADNRARVPLTPQSSEAPAGNNGTITPSVLRSVLSPLFVIAESYPDAEELVVNRPGEAIVERAGGSWETVMAAGLTFNALQAMALALAKSTSQTFSERVPVLFGTLPTGERLTFVGPPAVAPGTISLTMRLVKNTARDMSAYIGTDFFDRYLWLQEEPSSSSATAALDMVNGEQQTLVRLLLQRRLRDFLIEAVRKRLTLGILGDTGSGKTFLMECLIQEIPAQERLITIESARELQLPRHRNKVQMLYSHFGTGATSLDASSLMAVTKRMKPKRVLLGECIGPEAFVFLNMVLAGHAGSITSWHAKSIHVARDRFVLMCREHPDAKLHTPPDLADLFDLSMDAMLYIAVEEPPDADDLKQKHRYISDVWFNPFRGR